MASMTTRRTISQSITDCIARTNYVRGSLWGLGGTLGHREWFHFCVHDAALTLLFNFNFADDARSPDHPRQAGRVVALANLAGVWQGEVEEVGAISLSGGGLFIELGENLLEFRDGYFLIRLRLACVELDLVLEPVAFPSLAANVSLSASEAPINWLVVPRLMARGRAVIAGKEHRLDSALAYHDHNWGHFSQRDFSWLWGQVTSDDVSKPHSMVVSRLTNRVQGDVFMQAMLLWDGARQHRVLREAEVVFESRGVCRARAFTVPRPASLLLSGAATEVPNELFISAKGGGDLVAVHFSADHVARIAVPNDHDLGTTIIHEVLGNVTVEGDVRGESIAFRGRGAFEFLGSEA